MMKSSDEFRSHLGETENTKSMSVFIGYAQPDLMEEKWTDMKTDSFHWNPF